MLSGLMFSFGCESDMEEGNNSNSSSIDSLNAILSNYEIGKRELSNKITVLQEKLNEEAPPQEVKVIYKTKYKTKYKTDKAVLEDLESQKMKVYSQSSEIEQLRDTISQKESEIGEMQSLLDELESKNNKMLDLYGVTGRDSIIKFRLAISDIEVELFTRKVKDKKKKHIEIIETSFTINENRLTPKGDKTIHFCIYDCEQNVLHHSEGEMFKPLKGNEQFYTTVNQFFYDEEKLRMTISWEKKDLELKSGMYTTEFYIQNVFSGIGVFEVE